MRVRWWITLVLFAGVAHAEPAKRKAVPDKFVTAASEKFVQARKADNANNLDDARGLYEQAFEISPHPSTAYNLADVYRRKNLLVEAVTMYETYLLLAPKASDATDVNALIAKLTATPAVLTVKSFRRSMTAAIDLKTAYILLNGEIAKPAGEVVATTESGEPTIELPSPAPLVSVDVVSPLSYGTRTLSRLAPGLPHEVLVSAPPRTDGNVVIANHSDSVRVVSPVPGPDGKPRALEGRIVLAKGKVTLSVWDLAKECSLLTIDAPSNDDVLYVYVEAEATRYASRCRRIVIKQRRLKF